MKYSEVKERIKVMRLHGYAYDRSLGAFRHLFIIEGVGHTHFVSKETVLTIMTTAMLVQYVTSQQTLRRAEIRKELRKQRHPDNYDRLERKKKR